MQTKVNYLKEILAFNNAAMLDGLSTGQIALWYALMYVDNASGWQARFTVTNSVLSLHTGLSRSGILKARAELKEKGYINFFENGTKATEYQINFKCLISDSAQDSNQDGTQDSVHVSDSMQDSNQDSEQDSTHKSTQDSNTLINKNINKNIYNYSRAADTPSRGRQGPVNRFHNFHERDFDAADLERQLIANG